MAPSTKAKKVEKEHSDNCAKVFPLQRCGDCRKSYERERKRRQRKEIKEKKAKTRSASKKNESTYAYVFCNECRDNKRTKQTLCEKCQRAYNTAKRQKYRQKLREKNEMLKRKSCTISEYQGKEKTIVDIKSRTQIKLTDKTEVVNSSNGMCGVKISDKCKDKNKLKPKVSVLNVITPNTTLKTTTKVNLSDVDNSVQLQNRCSDKTIANYIGETKINKMPKWKKTQVVRTLFKKASTGEKMSMVKEVIPEFAQQLLGKVFKVMKDGNTKSSETYGYLNAMSKVTECKNITSAMKDYGIGRKKAKQMVKGEEISRKIKAFPKKTINIIEKFYKRDDISRVSPNVRETTKKHGARRYMRFPFRVAYRIFILENPKTKVGFSKFHSLKPKNIRARSKTPLISSLCCYCQNVNLKLQAINCPGLTSEYDLFNAFTCQKEPGNSLRRAECMYKTCQNCKDWEPSLRKYVSEKVDMKKEIHYLSWKTKTYETNKGKKSVRRVLENCKGTIEDCLNELIKEDLEKTSKICSFFEHYYAQIYQHKMYKSCFINLKSGVAILIQDFSRNRDIYTQSEIKSCYWTRTQVTMHPTVIYFIDMEGRLHRIVLTHLSDITLHDSHIVHYITKDCIDYLRETFPAIDWHKVIMWSDGCCSQYKGKHSFYYLNKLQNIFPQLRIQRNYFGSEHGKGESDAETGIFSRQIRDAIKSDASFLNNASQMCQFLKENNKEERIFRLFTDTDLKDIRDEFVGVSVATLEGKCTRSLHQIIPSKKTGILLTRPYSCFCQSCSVDMTNNCENKAFTLGKFIPRKLPSNDTKISCNLTNSEDDEEEDNEDNCIDPDDNMFKKDAMKELKIRKIDYDISDLEAMDFVITPLEKGTRIHYFVAQIQEVDKENKKLLIDYLRQHNFHEDIFHKTEIEVDKDYWVSLTDIIMKLRAPEEFRRGNKYFFHHRINLKNVSL